MEQRIAQAKRRGYKKLLVPINQQKKLGLGCIGVASIGEIDTFIHENAIETTSHARLSDGEKSEFAKCG